VDGFEEVVMSSSNAKDGGARREVPIGVLRAYPYWLGQAAAEGRVSARAVLLWAEIASLAKHGRRSRCDASLRYLAGRLPPGPTRGGEVNPVSERTVERLVDQLVEARALSVERRIGLRNVYIPHLEPLPEQEGLPLFGASEPVPTEEERDPNGIRTPAGEEGPPTEPSDTGVGGPPTKSSDTRVGESRGKHSDEAGAPPTLDNVEGSEAALRELERRVGEGDDEGAVDAFERLRESAGRAGPPPPGGAGPGARGTGSGATRRPPPPWTATVAGAFEKALPRLGSGQAPGDKGDELWNLLYAELDKLAPIEAIGGKVATFIGRKPGEYAVAEIVAQLRHSPFYRLAAEWIIERTRARPMVLHDRERYFRASLSKCAADVEAEARRLCANKLAELQLAGERAAG